MSHCSKPEINQNLMIEGEQDPDDKKEQKDEGANHMHLLEMMNEADSSSSDGLYMVDFRNFQFLQKIKNDQRVELTKNWNSIWDNKSVFLDSDLTFLCCINPKMLVGNIKCKKPMKSISNKGVIVTDMEGDLPGLFSVYYNLKSLMNIYRLMIRGKGSKSRWTRTRKCDNSTYW